ncbi:type VII secretion target [Microbacterium sp. ZW T5_56]|uniref:type VII secretion target n=1 Tax=Microbacterium sp. ZW T5_56 TaxID=3378081 RepID=UPI003852F128
MVADRIAISPSALTAHAQQVEQLATDVSVALDAVRGINLGGGAFGVMCAWMVPPALATSNIVISHIQQAQNVLQRTSDELVATAADFRSVEDGIHAALTGLMNKIDTAPGASAGATG